VLDLLLSVLRRKKHSAPVDAPAKDSRKAMMQNLNTEIRALRDSMTDKNVEQKASEFYALTKKSLMDALSIKYEATFQEIVAELEKKKRYSTKVREELDAFLEDISKMEYGYAHFEELLEEKRREQEKNLVKYIRELERDGEHVGTKTKKQIADIVSDNVPHSNREFLIKMMDDFKSIMQQLV